MTEKFLQPDDGIILIGEKTMTRQGLERRFAAYKIQIVNNVGRDRYYSVETTDGSPLGWGTLGTANTLLECESLIEGKIELHKELKG